jgi:hypothetical protein
VLAAAMQQHVQSLLAEPVLSESELKAVARLPQSDGKFFVVRGVVARVRPAGGLSKNAAGTADITLEGGTYARVTFSEVDGLGTKAEFAGDSMRLMKSKSQSIGSGGVKYRDFALAKILVEAGNKILINAKVENGRIRGVGLAETDAVAASKIQALEARDKVVIAPVRLGDSAGKSPTSGSVTTPSGTYQWNSNVDGSSIMVSPPMGDGLGPAPIEPPRSFTIERDSIGNFSIRP